MTSQERYQQLRKKYPTMSARAALHYARVTKPEPIDWEEGRNGKHATLTLDGFTVTLKVEPDYDHDWLDCRGAFSSTWQEGAIRNPESFHDSRVYAWFIPETTEEQVYRDLRKLKYGKTEAREMARSCVEQDMAIACDPDKAGYYVVGVQASASKEGIVLGEGSLWGIELAYGDTAPLDECAYDVAHEAVSEAKAALTRLQNA